MELKIGSQTSYPKVLEDLFMNFIKNMILNLFPRNKAKINPYKNSKHKKFS